MSLRTTALIAGVIGALLLAAGLIANAQRPPTDVMAVAGVDTPIVVYEPEMLAFVGESRIGFTADGPIEAVSARPADAAAWLATKDATRVTSLPDWETLSTTTEPLPLPEAAETPPEPTTSPDPTASPDASVSPEPTSSPETSPESTPTSSPEATPTTSPTATADDGDEATETPAAEATNLLTASSTDHWRESWRGEGRLAMQGAVVPPGEILVVVSTNGSPITQADLALTREVDDGWITPLIWWGAFLLTAGVIAFVLRLVDLRPVQARSEEWRAKRQRTTEPEPEPEPGSRRARRATGDVLPEPKLDEESIAAEAAARASGVTPASAPSAGTAPEQTEPQPDDEEESR